jgi:hypothetical protein
MSISDSTRSTRSVSASSQDACQGATDFLKEFDAQRQERQRQAQVHRRQQPTAGEQQLFHQALEHRAILP